MPEYDYECPNCKTKYAFIQSIKDYDKPHYCACGFLLTRLVGAPKFQVNGMNAAGGYCDTVGDIQKAMGRKIENHDMDKSVSTAGKI